MAAAAAAVLESVAVPRASSGFQKPAAAAASPRMAMASSISSVSGGHGKGLLPDFKGLKVARRAVRSAAVVGGGRVVRHRGVVCEAQDTAIDVPDVTTAMWQPSVMECDIPVLVEFWAPWCGPCRMILPVIGELSKEYAGKLKCMKLNTDDCPDIATKYGIRSIPTIMIFKNGEKKDAVVGAVPKSTLTASIEKFL